MNKTLMVMLIVAVMIGSVVFLLFAQLNYQIGSISPEISSQCPSTQYSYNESLGGSLKCSQVGYNQLNNFPGACSSNQYFTNISYPSTCKPIAQDYRLGLVGYWPFDSLATSTTTLDISGYGNTGTLTNSPVLVHCQFSYCLNFTASKNQYVNSNFGLPLYQETISSWINLSSGSSCLLGSASCYIIDFNGNNNALYISASDHVCVYINTALCSTSPLILANQWDFVSFTYSNISQILKIYLNGSSLTTFSSVSPQLQGSPLTIGAYTGLGVAQFNGKIDESRIYNFAFSAQQEANLDQYYENILNGV